MYGTRYVFSRDFFRGWVVVTFLIAWTATLVIIIMPLWQGRHTLRIFWKYITGGGSGHLSSTEGLSTETSSQAAREQTLGEKGTAEASH